MKFTAAEIAEHIGARLEGHGETILAGVAAPETACAEDLIYLDSPKFVERAEGSAARCVVTSEQFRISGKTLLLAGNPKLAFAKAAAWLAPRAAIADRIHPSAVIDPTAKLAAGVCVGAYAVIESGASLGARTQIGPHCVIGANSSLGEDCRLHARVTLYPGSRLGHRVILHSGAVIGSDGFGFVFGEGCFWPFPQVGSVELADDVEVGANSTVDRGSLAHTRLGQGTKLDNLVHVAHNVQIGKHTVVAAQTGISGSSTLGNHVLVGGQVGIADNCEIQDGAILGAQAGIPSGKTIRAGHVVWGTPARPLERFKQQYAWFARLPELADRVRKLEENSD